MNHAPNHRPTQPRTPPVPASLPASAAIHNRAMLAIYDIFGNRDDHVDDLRQLLDAYGSAHTLRVQGCVALFKGYR